jgi:hypothetical protein
MYVVLIFVLFDHEHLVTSQLEPTKQHLRYYSSVAVSMRQFSMLSNWTM